MKYVEYEGLQYPTFNKGDVVTVTRKACEEEKGWSDCWVDAMDEFIGKKCIVVSEYSNKGGVSLKLNKDSLETYSFPHFVVTKINDFQIFF